MFLFAFQILYTLDFVLMPFFLALWIGIMYAYKNTKYKDTILGKYFMPALCARLLGAVLTALMYQYYYGYGDTFFYYFGANDIYNALIGNINAAIEMLLVDSNDWSPQTYDAITYRRFFSSPTEATVIRISGLVSPLGLGTYLGISFVLTIFSFLGCWAIYRVFYDLYPHLHKPLAYAILFLPSMCFWSTGIMKDSLVIAGLGLFVNGIYNSIISPQKQIGRSVIFMIIGVWLMKSIKVYVLASILPAVVIWVFFMYKERISNPTLKKIAGPVFFVVGALGGVVALQQLGSMFSEFTFEGFMQEAAQTQWWLKLSTDRDGGTGYDLGTLDPSFAGLVRVFPAAVNVALFRPYLWEARKVIVMPSALEALFTLFFTLYVFYKVGIFKILKYVIGDPVILFCLTFSIIFAFAVGFTSYNFGALARYKIPCLPFYYTAIILLWDKVPKPAQEEQLSSHQSIEIETNLKPKSV